MKIRINILIGTILSVIALIGCEGQIPEPLYNNQYDPQSPNFNDSLAVGKWTLIQEKKDVNFSVPELVFNNETCYLLGGIDRTNTILNSMYSFVLSDSSSSADSILLSNQESMLFHRKEFSAIAYNGIIYTFGGDTNGTVEVYNLIENRWFSLGVLPTSDMQFGTAVIQLGDSIIVFGGKSISGGASNKAWLYKPSVNLWSLFTTLPVRIVSPTIQILGNKLYMAGGFDSVGHATSSIYAFDLRDKSWTLFPDTLKEPRGNSVSTLRNGRIYIFGGQNEYGAFSLKVDEIKVSNGKCVKKADIPYPVLPYGCFNYADKMKLICGARDYPLMVLEFDLVY